MQQLPGILICPQGDLLIPKAKEQHFSCRCLTKKSCITMLDRHHFLVFDP